MLTRLLVTGWMGAARLVEIAYSQRNLRGYEGSRELPMNKRIFPLIAGLNTLVIAATLLFGGRVRWPWLILLLAVQPLRYWVIATLGRRWNVRAAVPAKMEIAISGPYAFVRHPNYSVLLVELAALPASFGLYRLAMAATVANALLLSIRVHEEEKLLFDLPAYAEHFASKRRFVPGVV